jgi:hypothetical protein
MKAMGSSRARRFSRTALAVVVWYLGVMVDLFKEKGLLPPH